MGGGRFLAAAVRRSVAEEYEAVRVEARLEAAHGGGDRIRIADIAVDELDRSAGGCAQPFQIALAARPR